MNKVKVVISNRQNDVKIPTGIRLLVRRCCNASLREENFTEDAEISVSFVNNEEIRELNAKHRGKDAVTDVLSFPLGENGQYAPWAKTASTTATKPPAPCCWATSSSPCPKRWSRPTPSATPSSGRLGSSPSIPCSTCWAMTTRKAALPRSGCGKRKKRFSPCSASRAEPAM